LQARARNLRLESLEDRRLLSIDTPNLELFSVSPALFVENQGQWADESLRFVHQGSGGAVAMTDTGPVFSVLQREPTEDQFGENEAGDDPLPDLFDPDEYALETLTFSACFVGANEVVPAGMQQSETLFNYFVGDESTWQSNVAAFEAVAYEGLYEGIDLKASGLRSGLKYEFCVAPGAAYSQIVVRYDGISGLSLAEDGSLVLNLGEGWDSLTDAAPYIYQIINGTEVVEVAGRFAILDQWTYTFEITGAFDPAQPLMIDPELAWSTYLGGSGYERGYGIAVDNAGNALVTGYTDSTDFAAATNSHAAKTDAFVAKVSPSGQTLWATYIGGSNGDYGLSIAVDGAGHAFVTGDTYSTNFAGRTNSYLGAEDAFVAKVSPSGQLLWATYLGGTKSDEGRGISVDVSGNALVTGNTESDDFLGHTNSFLGAESDWDAFVAMVSPSGQTLWATYLGGTGNDLGESIAVDGAGNLLVGGTTESTNFSEATNSFLGYADGFVAMVSPIGGTVWATYLGGAANDQGLGIAADTAGNALVTGYTGSTNFAGRNNSHRGAEDAFVAKVSPTGETFWATYLGGSSLDRGQGIAVDAVGNAVVTGYTWSDNFTGVVNSCMGADAFVARVSPDGDTFWASYLGGNGSDRGWGIAADAAGDALVVGDTGSTSFAGATNSYLGGAGDAFVAKLLINEPPVADAGGPYTVPQGGFLALDASGSVDIDQPTDTLLFEWDLDYDGMVFDVDKAGIQPSVCFPDNFAPRTIAVRVTDYGGLTDIATTTLEVTNVAPTIILYGSTGTETDGQPQSFSWEVTDASGLSYAEVSITRDTGSGPEEIYRTAEPFADLVAWWPGEDGQDIVGNNEGTLLGGASLVPGQVGSAFRFHGVDDFDGAEDLFRASAAALPTGNQDRTMELWVNIRTVPSYGDRGIAAYGNFGSYGQSYGVFVDPLRNNAIAFSQWGSAVFGPELTLGEWHHVAVTNVGNSVKLYLDGEQVASGPLSINTAAGSEFYVGGNPYQSTSQLDGDVDEISVYSRALTEEEIRGIYQASAAGKGVPSSSGSFNFDDYGLGTYTLRVSARDRDVDRPGDVLVATNNRSVVVTDDDTVAPKIWLANVALSQLDSQEQFFLWEVTDASGLSSLCVTVIQQDDQGTREVFRTETLSHAISQMCFDEFGLGSFTITVSATDNDVDRVGDQLTATATKTVVVTDDDTSAPIIELYGSVGNEVDGQTQGFSWRVVGEPFSKLQSVAVAITRDSGTGPEQVYFSADPTYPVIGSFNFDAFGIGTYHISVSATDGDNDRAGDSLSATGSRTVVVSDDDIAPPAVTLTGSSGTETDGQPQSFSWDVSDASGLSYAEVSITRDTGSGPEEIYRTTEPFADLAAWWPGEDGQDIVGNNDGTLTGGASLVPGQVGSAFNFDGVDGAFVAPVDRLPTGNQDRTMELWVRFDSFPSSVPRHLAGYGNFGFPGQIYSLFVDTEQSNKIAFTQWGSSIWGPALSVDHWYHVAVTNIGNTEILYLDGVAVATGALAVNTPSGGQFCVGSNVLQSSIPMDGQVDEISVYNRALTADEIRGIYQAGAAGKGVASTSGSFNFDDYGLGTYALTVSARDRDIDRAGDALSAVATRSVLVEPNLALHWQGDVDENWSTPGNWLENQSPRYGDTLIFDTNTEGFTRFSSYNDLTALVLGGVQLSDDLALESICLTGHAVTLEGDLALTSTSCIPRPHYISLDGLVLGTDVNVHASSNAASLNVMSEIETKTFTMGVTGSGYKYFHGVISGAGGVAVTSGGTTWFNAANTYSGITQVDKAMLGIQAFGRLGDSEMGTVVTDGVLIVSREISSDEPVTLSGAYSTLRIGKDAIQAGDIAISTNSLATIEFSTGSGSGTGRITGAITGAAKGNGLRFAAGDVASTLVLSGANSYSGETRIEQGVLRIENAAALGTIDGGTTVLAGAGLEVDADNVYEPLTLAGAGVSGTGALRKVTGGYQNWYGPISLASDSLVAINTGGMAFYGTVDTGAGYQLTCTVPFGLGASIKGSIIGSGGLTKEGRGSLFLQGANGYAGQTLVEGGALRLWSPATLGTADSGTIVREGGWVEFNAVGQTIAENLILGDDVSHGTLVINSSNITWTGGITLLGDGEIQVSSNVTANWPFRVQDGTLDLGNHTLLVTSAGPASISSPIVGTGNVVKRFGGTLTVSGANSYSGETSVEQGVLRIENPLALGTADGGTTVLAGATLILPGNISVADEALLLSGNGVDGNGALHNCSGPGSTWDGPIALDADTSVRTDGMLNVYNVVSGRGGLTKLGEASLNLGGLNTYEGETVVNGGTIWAFHDGAFGNTASGTRVENGRVVVMNGVQTDEPFWIKPGTQLELTNSVVVNGPITLAGGLLRYGTGTQINGDILLTGSVSIGARSDVSTLNINGTITDDGSNPALTLSTYAANVAIFLNNPANAYGGSTIVAGSGRVVLGAPDVIPDGSAVTVDAGATLDLASFDETLGSLAGPGKVALGTGDLAIGASDASSEFTGTFTGSGELRKTGSGTFRVGGDSRTFQGPVVVDGGVLQLGNANVFPESASYHVSPGANFDLNGFDLVAGALSGSGVVALGDQEITLGFGDGSSTFGGSVGGIGGRVAKTGSGTLTLSGANSYTGETRIEQGVLRIENAAALGTIDGGTTVLAGASLEVDADNVYEPLTLAGAGVSGTGALRKVTGGYQNWYGPISLAGDSLVAVNTGGMAFYGNVDTGTGYQLTLTVPFGLGAGIRGSIIGSGGLTKEGQGSLFLYAVNSYTGQTIVEGGALRLWSPATLGTADSGTIVRGGGWVELNTGGNTIAENLVLGDDVSVGRLIINSGNITWTGDIELAGDGEIQNSSQWPFLVASPSFDLGGHTLTVSGFPGTTTISSPIVGTGGVVKKHSSTVVLSGANSYTGETRIEQGVLRIENAAALGTIDGGTTVLAGASLEVDADNVYEPLTLAGAGVSGTGALRKVTGGYQNWYGPISLAGDSLVAVNTGGMAFYGNVDTGTGYQLTLTVPFGLGAGIRGSIIGSGGLTKEGQGSLFLYAVNSYTGQTIVEGGALRLWSPATLGTADSGTIVRGGGWVELNTGGKTIGENLILGDDVSHGTLVINSSNITWTGDITLLGDGEIQVSSNVTANWPFRVQDGTLDLGNHALLVTSAGPASISSPIVGTGNVVKRFGGTLTLSGANSYSGETSVEQGVLRLPAEGNVSASQLVRISNGASMEIVATSADEILTVLPTETEGTVAVELNSVCRGLICNLGQLVALGQEGNDAITLEGAYGAVTIDGGNGSDTYTACLGAAGSPVTINDSGTDGSDTLIVIGTEAPDLIAKVPGHITYGDPVVQTVDFTGIEHITLDGRGGDDQITDAGATQILGGEGNDTIWIIGSDPTGVLVDGEGGTDSISVSLGSLQGNVEVVDSGTEGGDAVVVVGTANDDQLTISGNQLTAGAEVIRFASLTALGVDAGAGNDTITVLPLAEPIASLELLGGDGTDAITVDNVGASVGTMVVDGGAGGQDSFAAIGDLPGESQIQNLALVLSEVSITPVFEGEEASLTARITDPDSTATYFVTVDWGDGSAIEEVSYPPGTTSISRTHRYLDNNISDGFLVRLTVTTSTGVSTAVYPSVTVENVAPLVNAGDDATIAEGAAFTGSGAFTDPGADTWTATVDYGGNSGVQPLALNPDGSFDLDHVYMDDGLYTVTVTVTDDDGGVGSDTRTVTVTNVTPTLDFNQPPYTVWENETTTTMFEVNDPGADTRTVQIGWGDGKSGTYVLPDNWRVFTKGDFGAEDWQQRVVEYGNGGAVTVSQQAYPGTSDTYRRIDIALNDSPEAWISQAGVHNILPSTLYNPQTEGEIVTVDFELTDFRLLDTTAREFCFKLVVRQGGYYFVSPNYPVAHFGQTRTEKLTFTQDSFRREDSQNIHPDFSISGGPIEFGFFVHALVGYGEPGVNVSMGVDNFVVAVNRSVIARHQYLDDPAGAGDGQYTVSILATDDDGGAVSAAKQVLVKNVAPVVTLEPVATIDEGGTASLAGSITDPGTLDTFTLTIEWGDPSSPNNFQSFALGTASLVKANDGIDWNPVTRRFTADHPYLSQVSSAAAQWQHTIGVNVKDDDDGHWVQDTSVTIRNLVDISGRLFNDMDNDGIFDEDQDLPLPNVLVKVWDEAMEEWIAETATDPEGRYFLNANLGAGTYRLVELYDDDPDSLGFQGLLDGEETAGDLGGTTINDADSKSIFGIIVDEPGMTADAVDYLFGKIELSEIYGRVWRDFNNDGQVNFNEADIDGVPITLSGTDDRGRAVDLTTTTAGGTGFAFINLRPGAYAIEETQAAGFDDGLDSLGEVTNPHAVNQPTISAGYVDGNDRFSGIALAPGSTGDFYNFGELPTTGEGLTEGSTASIGFWHNKNGQALIQHLSDFAEASGGSPTQLGDWLAATFPSMYGEGARYDAASGEGRDMNLADKTDLYIAETFVYLHQRNKKTMIENGGVPKIDAQVLALALATYATSENLAGTAAQPYGFATSADGISYSTFDILSVLTLEEANLLGLSMANGNLDASGSATILDILLTTNAKATLGLLYDYDQDLDDGDDGGDGTIDAFERLLRILANDLYSAINE
jgi:autotransporter-associated beta strand protein